MNIHLADVSKKKRRKKHIVATLRLMVYFDWMKVLFSFWNKHLKRCSEMRSIRMTRIVWYHQTRVVPLSRREAHYLSIILRVRIWYPIGWTLTLFPFQWECYPSDHQISHQIPQFLPTPHMHITIYPILGWDNWIIYIPQ